MGGERAGFIAADFYTALLQTHKIQPRELSRKKMEANFCADEAMAGVMCGGKGVDTSVNAARTSACATREGYPAAPPLRRISMLNRLIF